MVDTATEYMLTTVDNPYNPFTHFTEWQAYDTQAGYNTLAFQSRVAIRSPDLSDLDQWLAEEEALNEIARENVSGMHRLVDRNGKPKLS